MFGASQFIEANDYEAFPRLADVYESYIQKTNVFEIVLASNVTQLLTPTLGTQFRLYLDPKTFTNRNGAHALRERQRATGSLCALLPSCQQIGKGSGRYDWTRRVTRDRFCCGARRVSCSERF
jgi:hypothetical protein